MIHRDVPLRATSKTHCPPIALGAAVALLACLCRCRSNHDVAPPIGPDAAPPATSTPAVSAVELPPLGGDWLVHLPLDGFGQAAVSVPLGTTSPRPIVVGVHARNDRPEWACGEWRGITEARPFILCPHGVPVDAPPEAGLVFEGAERTRREIDAGLDALRARFGRYVAEGPIILAGISLGAILGVQIVASDPARFPIAVLDEGGWEQWTPGRVTAFAKGGGKRVLFVCSTAFCENQIARPMAGLARAGVEVKLVSAGNIGHLVDDRVVRVVRAAWPWVVGEAPSDASR